MTKNQRNMLELAYINTLVDPVLRGNSFGVVDPEKKFSVQEFFDRLGDDIRALRSMDDETLLKSVGANETFAIDIDPINDVPKFESYDELYQYLAVNLDKGDLQRRRDSGQQPHSASAAARMNQIALDVLYAQIMMESFKEN